MKLQCYLRKLNTISKYPINNQVLVIVSNYFLKSESDQDSHMVIIICVILDFWNSEYISHILFSQISLSEESRPVAQ